MITMDVRLHDVDRMTHPSQSMLWIEILRNFRITLIPIGAGLPLYLYYTSNTFPSWFEDLLIFLLLSGLYVWDALKWISRGGAPTWVNHCAGWQNGSGKVNCVMMGIGTVNWRSSS
jgi:hypothetical protein